MVLVRIDGLQLGLLFNLVVDPEDNPNGHKLDNCTLLEINLPGSFLAEDRTHLKPMQHVDTRLDVVAAKAVGTVELAV